ncbi:MAG: PadR family transcriptional regulator [Clostridia bacterium]|nr:PadR family transcriptional regulator [Clostridia bacterium]MBQ7755105.1 PadR family transcriptional regulator [Clostridia bacterium]
MDVQMKRGLLDVCVLAAIQSEDSYGYQIIKDIRPYVDVSESTLYPILRRLEEGRLLTVRSVEHNGRLRKYYHITDAGKARIEDFKRDWDEMEKIYRFITKEGKQ